MKGKPGALQVESLNAFEKERGHKAINPYEPLQYAVHEKKR